MFENRVLRGIFGPKKDEVTGEWRKLQNEKLSYLYSLHNIVRVVKSRRMRWVGHVARMGEGRVVHRVLMGNISHIKVTIYYKFCAECVWKINSLIQI